MRPTRIWGAATAATLGLTGAAAAQLPAAPAVPAAPPVPAAPAVPGAAGIAPPKNLWSFFMLTPDQKAACAAKKEKFCKSTFGQLFNNVARPLTAFTGGVLPECCPPEKANVTDLQKPATEAEGAAARIQKLEAEAKARRVAVRYLGTVDCRRFPEAEVALITALRTDTNECVRFEAALGLTRGCCCTKKIIDALKLTVEASTKDGNPAEASDRVRGAAATALAHCVSCYTEPPAAPAPRPEGPPEKPPTVTATDGTPLRLAAYYTTVETRSTGVVLSEAQRALDDYARATATRPMLATGGRSLYEAVVSAGPVGLESLPVTTSSEPPVAAKGTTALPPLTPVAATGLPPLVPTPAAEETPAVPTAPATGKRSLLEILRGH